MGSVTEIGKQGAATSLALLVGNTQSGQPVYRSEISFFQTDKAVLLVTGPAGATREYYVINLPLDVSLDKRQWSDWTLPNYQTSQDPFFLLVNGKPGVRDPYEIPMGADTPRVRFLLQDFKNSTDWIRIRRENSLEHDLRSC